MSKLPDINYSRKEVIVLIPYVEYKGELWALVKPKSKLEQYAGPKLRLLRVVRAQLWNAMRRKNFEAVFYKRRSDILFHICTPADLCFPFTKADFLIHKVPEAYNLHNFKLPIQVNTSKSLLWIKNFEVI